MAVGQQVSYARQVVLVNSVTVDIAAQLGIPQRGNESMDTSRYRKFVNCNLFAKCLMTAKPRIIITVTVLKIGTVWFTIDRGNNDVDPD